MLAEKIGLDTNHVVVTEGGGAGDLSIVTRNADLIAGTDVGWVRVNFIRLPWQRPDDGTRFAGHTWLEAYRAAIDAFRQRGLRVYGLIGHEATPGDPGDMLRRPPEEMSDGERANAQRWIDEYADIFGWIVEQLQDVVTTVESFNEPDDWHAADRNWIHPRWFARMLQAVYDNVRNKRGIKGVTLVTGPLQGLDINANGAAPYLRNTYGAGQEFFGWGSGQPFPFDGIGYHLYIIEGYNADWEDHVRKTRERFQSYIAGMMDVIHDAEGPASRRRLYVSEMGWQSDQYNPEREEFQAKNAQLAVQLMSAEPNIALGFWFCTQDFGDPGGPGQKWYGLFRKGDLTLDNAKPIYTAFQNACVACAPGQAAFQYRNQDVINAFFAAAPALGVGAWTLMTRAGLTGLVSARNARYTGLPISDLPNLTDDQKAAISAQLAETRAIGGGAAPSDGSRDIGPAPRRQSARLRRVLAARAHRPHDPSRDITPTAGGPTLTNQDVINAMYFAATQLKANGWDWLTRAGLTDIVKARKAPYSGPSVLSLPNLTNDEKALLVSKLPQPQPDRTRPLVGKGMWIWSLGRCEGGDPTAIAELAKAAELTHVIIKVADAAAPFNIDAKKGDLVAPVVAALRGAGITVWGWQYIYAGADADPEAQAATAIARVRQLGMEGFVVNAEVEFNGQPEAATRYMQALRAGLPTLPIALSSFRFPKFHQDFPWKEFLAYCDINMPQVYWYSDPPDQALVQSLAQNAALPNARPVIPTGAAYVMDKEAQATPDEIQKFLQAAAAQGLPAVNFWSWQHAGDQRWAAIGGFAWPTPTPAAAPQTQPAMAEA